MNNETVWKNPATYTHAYKFDPTTPEDRRPEWVRWAIKDSKIKIMADVMYVKVKRSNYSPVGPKELVCLNADGTITVSFPNRFNKHYTNVSERTVYEFIQVYVHNDHMKITYRYKGEQRYRTLIEDYNGLGAIRATVIEALKLGKDDSELIDVHMLTTANGEYDDDDDEDKDQD